MANTRAIWQQAAHTTYQPSSPTCSTRAIQKSITLNEKYLSFLEEKNSGEWTISRKITRQKEQEDQAEKEKEKKEGEKSKRGDRKGESNDSSEIPDRHPRPPFGD